MDPDLSLLRAYLDGTLPSDQMPLFEDWLRADPQHLQRLVMASAMEAQLDQLVSDRVGTDAALVERPAISQQLGEELVAAYIAGELAEAELSRLQQWLQYDAHRLRRLMLDAAFEYDLHQEVSARVESDRYEPSTDQTPLRLSASGAPLSDRRPRSPIVMTITSYAAAGVLLAAALLLWIAFPPQSERRSASERSPDPAVSVATPTAGSLHAPAEPAPRYRATILGQGWAIERAGQKLALESETPLRPGDRVLVAADGHAELLISDGSHVLVDAGSVLDWQGAQSFQMELAHGQLRVAAADQHEAPLRIRTAAAVAIVVGTVFTLESDGERTLLQVHEGEVQLATGSQRLAVQAGSAAAADHSGLHLLQRSSNWLGADLPPLGSSPTGLLPFVDLMRYARAWTPSYAEDLPVEQRLPLTVDEAGWLTQLAPGQRALTTILNGGSYPSGVYTCHYEGEGQIQFGYGANIIRSERGRLEVDVTALPYGLMLYVIETDPEDPIRNISLVMPGFEASFREQPYNPAFVDALRGIGVLRAYAWSEGRGADWLSWQDRRRPGDGPGLEGPAEQVAIEDLLRLVKLLDCELWLTAPYNADDGYLRGLAELVHAGLPAERRCYLEYSSEIWNGMFDRVQWCRAQGEALGYPSRGAEIAFANDRSEALWSAFESVTAGARPLVRVLSYHEVAYFRDHQQAHGAAFERADALAVYGGIRGVIGGELGLEGLATADRDQLLDAIQPLTAQALAAIDELRTLRQRYGKRVLAYHAGGVYWADPVLGISSADPISKQAAAIASDPAFASTLGSWLAQWRRQIGDVAIIPLGGDYRRQLRQDTPGYSRWARAPTGPSWWTLYRQLEPITPFPPQLPKAASADEF